MISTEIIKNGDGEGEQNGGGEKIIWAAFSTLAPLPWRSHCLQDQKRPEIYRKGPEARTPKICFPFIFYPELPESLCQW